MERPLSKKAQAKIAARKAAREGAVRREIHKYAREWIAEYCDPPLAFAWWAEASDAAQEALFINALEKTRRRPETYIVWRAVDGKVKISPVRQLLESGAYIKGLTTKFIRAQLRPDSCFTLNGKIKVWGR